MKPLQRVPLFVASVCLLLASCGEPATEVPPAVTTAAAIDSLKPEVSDPTIPPGPLAVQKSLGFLVGIHCDYGDSVSFSITSDLGDTAFYHTGKWEHVGVQPQAALQSTGRYWAHVRFLSDTVQQPDIVQPIDLQPNVEALEVSFALVNGLGGQFNTITSYPYFGNELGLVLQPEPGWNPTAEFANDTVVSPRLQALNTYDSLVFGVLLRQSTSLTTSWMQTHNLGALRVQQLTENGWQNVACNQARIQMALANGATGNMLPDERLGCPPSALDPELPCRAVLEYGINNRGVYQQEAKGHTPMYTYLEQPVYRVFYAFLLT